MAEGENGNGNGSLPYEKRILSSEAERQAVATAKLAVTDAIARVSHDLGVNIQNEEAVDEFRKDMKFIRSLRKRPAIWDDLRFLSGTRASMIKMGSRFALAVVTLMAGAFVYGMVLAFKGWLEILMHKPPP